MSKDPRQELIAELCSFTGRIAGTDAERRAANMLVARLRALGRKAEAEPTYVHPQAPIIHAAHAALAFAGSLLAVEEPVAGFALVLFAATSLYLDLNARFYLLRRLFFRRASQNVVSPGGRKNPPARLLLVAHYDAARTGFIFDPRPRAFHARLWRLFGFAPARLLFWSIALLVPLAAARAAGVESDAIPLAQLPFTLILLLAAFLLTNVQLSDPSPAANDNASGVAVALALAETLREQPARNLDVSVALTGAQECGAEGMRELIRAHRNKLDRQTTFVIALDSLGAGDIRWLESDGPAVAYEMDARLGELCQAIADADSDGRYRAAPLRSAAASDALAARVHRLRATAITARKPRDPFPANHHTAGDTPDAIDPKALARAHDFTLDLIRALDRDVARAKPPRAG